MSSHLSPDHPPTVPGRVSFVVPTRNSGRTIEACLRSIQAQQDADVEVIVVDNHSTDATPAIAAGIADRLIVAGPERSAQRNHGARAATGQFVVFIDSDMVLSSGIAADVRATFARTPEVSGLIIPELAFGSGFWASCRELEKRLYLGDPTVEAARAFPTDVFLAAGGYNLAHTGHEDWELPDRLQRAGGTIGRIDAVVHHDEGRISLTRQFAKKRYYGRDTRSYVAEQRGRALRRLARTSLFTRPRLLLAHPRRALGLTVLKSVEAAGLLSGTLSRRAV